MTQQFYVSPEQLMKDRADFARKGITRGRSVAVVHFADGAGQLRPQRAVHLAADLRFRLG